MNKKIVLLCFLFCSIEILSQSFLERQLSPNSLPYLKKSKLIQISSYDTTGGNNDRINILPGKTAVIADIKGPGIISRIWVTIDSRDPYFLRRIVLKMYWDNEKDPSVEVPVGDFFGTGFEYRHYASQFVGMTSGGYYSYFPMPFEKAAKIEVVNETGQEVYAFYYQIDYQRLEEPLEKDVAYFHAQWNRQIKTDTAKNYLILNAEGEGHVVGVNMSMQSYKKNLWFLEGDEMVYVDGEKFPSIYGTGTEDYFTSGWYFNKGEFSAPYHGLILKDDSLGRIAVYRFHVADAIPFKKSILFTIEHGHANEETADYSSTVYWYQKEPHKKFLPMLKASLRIPLRTIVPEGVIEGEDLLVENASFFKADMSDYGAEWSGFAQLEINNLKPEQNIKLIIPSGDEKKYNAELYLSKAPSYGDFEIIYSGNKSAFYSGYSEEMLPGDFLQLKDLKPHDGRIELEFKIKGKNEKSLNYNIGIDAVKLTPVREYIPEWYIIGPFDNPRLSETERQGLDIKYQPETEFDTLKGYIGTDSQKVKWYFERTPENGRVSLYNKFQPNEHVVAYANTFIYSPKDQTVPLLIGSDDGIKVFLNDIPIFRFLEVRISEPDQDRLKLNLKEGWNRLLLKIENNFGGYAFFARIIDKENSLIISPFKMKK